MRKHYNPLKRECSTCETLMNKEYYKKFHTQAECNVNRLFEYKRKGGEEKCSVQCVKKKD
jgi:hypothetical protein